MKLISWNVNGLRACVGKGFLDFFRDVNADMVCLQETKLQPGQIELDLPGYEQFWCSAEKKGYSGTAIFTKHPPLDVRYELPDPALGGEGRVITLEYDGFYMVTCYTPNSQDGLKRLDHRMVWDDAFRDYLSDLDGKKPVIACGDLNVAHQEIDLKNPSTNHKNAGFTEGEPWFFVNPNYTRINAEAEEEDEDSILNFYRRCLRLRKSSETLLWGDYREHYPLSGSVYMYERSYKGERIIVICSFSGKTKSYRLPKGLEGGELLLDNLPDGGKRGVLSPYEAQIWRFKS